MIQVTKSPGHSDTFDVVVDDGGSQVVYRVTLTDAQRRELGCGDIASETVIAAAFRFLLDREPKESILGNFAVPDISRYFPEFLRTLPRYVAGQS